MVPVDTHEYIGVRVKVSFWSGSVHHIPIHHGMNPYLALTLIARSIIPTAGATQVAATVAAINSPDRFVSNSEQRYVLKSA